MAGPTVLAQRRSQRRRFVARDLLRVAIVRTVKHRGPGRSTPPTRTVLAEQDARLVQRLGGDQVPSLMGGEPGPSTPSRRYYLALYHDADVAAGTGTLDEFDVAAEGHFEVVEVVNEREGGDVYGKMAVLRKVANA